MTELRKRMIEDMQLAGHTQGTQEAYLRAARQLAAHYRLSPDRLTERQLRDYIIRLRDVRAFAKGNLPTLLRGVIDLAFLEPHGWVIVDYKTDRAAPEAIPGLAAYYVPQLLPYAKVWRDLTGQGVQETGLFFTHPSCYVKV